MKAQQDWADAKRDSERVGSEFDYTTLIEAQQLSFEAIDRIASQIRPGMTEEAATLIAKATLEEMGFEKHWHRPYVRFERNTLLAWNQASEKGVTLTDDGIYFLDLGPVWKNHEGDAGKTFVVGRDPEKLRCARDSEEIFGLVRERWKSNAASGQALYEFAEEEARSRGWQLNLFAGGHRVGDFPHKHYSKDSLKQIGFTPAQGLWVLEIQLRHPTREFGSFYEDFLA